MIDLGQSLYGKNYFFQKLTAYRLIVNPDAEGYPPLFLLCKERRGNRRCEYVIGMTYSQFNSFLMSTYRGMKRNKIAEWLADQVITDSVGGEFSFMRQIGHPMVVKNVDLATTIKRHEDEAPVNKTPLYFFQVSDNQNIGRA